MKITFRISTYLILMLTFMLMGCGPTKEEDERYRLILKLEKLEIQLFDRLSHTDKDKPELYDEVKNQQLMLDLRQERVKHDMSTFKGKKCYPDYSPGGVERSEPTPAWKELLNQKEECEWEARALDERKREIARQRGGIVKDGEVVNLWEEREYLLAKIKTLDEKIEEYGKSWKGIVRSIVRLIVLVLLVIGVLILIIRLFSS